VHTSLGDLHILRYPWLLAWARFLHGSLDETPEPPPPATPPTTCASQCVPVEADESSPFTAAVVGVVALRDPSIGETLFAMQNNGMCSKLQLELLAQGDAASLYADEHNDSVQAHFDIALKSLTHHRPPFNSDSSGTDDITWERCRAELAAAPPHDSMAAFERALAALAGPESVLRLWGALVEETKARTKRMQEQTAGQPLQQATLEGEVESLDARLQSLQHKANLANAIQHNLDARSQNLRAVLRAPVLWPSGAVSHEERQQHRQLQGLRDRVLEGRMALQKLVRQAQEQRILNAVNCEHEASTNADLPFPDFKLDVPQLSLSLEAESATGSASLSDERAELKMQGETLEKLCLQLKDVMATSDSAYRHAQSLADSKS